MSVAAEERDDTEEELGQTEDADALYSAIDEEVLILSSLYEEEGTICRDPQHPRLLTVRLSFGFLLEVEFPRRGYLEGEALPSFTVRAGGPNTIIQHEFNARLQAALGEVLSVGQPQPLMLAVPLANELAEEAETAYRRSLEETARKQEEERERLQRREDEEEEEREWLAAQAGSSYLVLPPVGGSSAAPFFFQSKPIVDRKSKFIAHLTRVGSEAEVRVAITYLRSIKDIASACHPTIWAYRFRHPETQRLHAERDDDGETGASSRLAFLLEQLQVEGWLVVVTRWFGGTLLGPDRFKHIMAVAREVLTEGIPPAAASQEEKKKRR